VRVLSRVDVQQAVAMDAAIVAVRRAFAQLAAGGAEVPQRTPVEVAPRGAVTLFMPAYLRDDRAMGCKVVSVHPRNREAGLPTIHALVLLIDEATGRPLAALEGGYLTALRTGAASGVATDALARPGARVLACFGAGAQAEAQVEAVCAVRPIERVWIRSRSVGSAGRLARAIAGRRGVPADVRVADGPAQALAEADVVCTATTSRTPVFDGRDLRPGTHVNAVGAYTAAMQEVDAESLRRARIVVDSRAACLAEAGDLVVALGQGAIAGPETWAELGEVLLGRAPGRRSAEQVTYFKSVGNAVQDVATAMAAWREAERRGLGVVVAL
jgi:ornithine cyclodeaminase/alanine dehydrogenase-like protein (mu-crystallin family)